MGYYDSLNLYQYCWNNSTNWTDPYGLSYNYWQAFEGEGSAYWQGVKNHFVGILRAPGDYYESFHEAGLSMPVALGETVIMSLGKVFSFGTLAEGLVGVDVRSGRELCKGESRRRIVSGGIGTAFTAWAGANSLNAALPSSGPTVVSHWGSKGLQNPSWVMKGKPSPGTYLRSGKWDPLPYNKFAWPRTGQGFTVPGGTLKYPSGWDAWKGTLGQRIYTGPPIPSG